MNHINAAGMVASNEREAISQAFFFDALQSGWGCKGAGPLARGRGGEPRSPRAARRRRRAIPPCQDVMPDTSSASSASPHHGPRSEHSPASGQPPHAGNGPGGHAPAASHPGASNSDA